MDAATPPLPLYKFAELGQRDGLGQKQRHDSKEDHVHLLAQFLDFFALAEQVPRELFEDLKLEDREHQ